MAGMKRKGSGGGSGPGSGGSGRGGLKVRVKTARGRKLSSTRWLQRQLNDPYVEAARRDGLRSRAAYKLSEIDDRHRFLKPGALVVDLGAAPGGWAQVAVNRVGPRGRVVGIDLKPIDAMAGADFLELDFEDADAPDRLKARLGGKADVVLSDMAASATGHKQTDHLRIVALCDLAADFARDVLAPGGAFLAKVLQGGTEPQLLARLRQDYRSVAHVKPKASRADSSEIYVLAKGFRGAGTSSDP
ncbi:MAG: RlmE family RNA methyltransferase [Pseudomonadota bacterium]